MRTNVLTLLLLGVTLAAAHRRVRRRQVRQAEGPVAPSALPTRWSGFACDAAVAGNDDATLRPRPSATRSSSPPASSSTRPQGEHRAPWCAPRSRPTTASRPHSSTATAGARSALPARRPRPAAVHARDGRAARRRRFLSCSCPISSGGWAPTPRPTRGRCSATRRCARRGRSGTKRAAPRRRTWCATCAAYLDHLAARRCGVTGYCMGGRLALLAAEAYPDRIAAAAAYPPGGLVGDAPDSAHAARRPDPRPRVRRRRERGPELHRRAAQDLRRRADRPPASITSSSSTRRAMAGCRATCRCTTRDKPSATGTRSSGSSAARSGRKGRRGSRTLAPRPRGSVGMERR